MNISKQYIILFVLFLFLFTSCKVYEEIWYRNAIPAPIKLGRSINFSASVGIREACGVAIFKLSNASAKKIMKEGLTFFKDAKHGRGYSESNYYYTYDRWRETPVSEWNGGMMCASLSKPLTTRIYNAGNNSGSYYTTKPEALLLVSPREKLVMLEYFG
jgi:hypothetical protein